MRPLIDSFLHQLISEGLMKWPLIINEAVIDLDKSQDPEKVIST